MAQAQPNLILSDARGVYIPQNWAEMYGTAALNEDCGIQADDVATCLEGPDAEWYWDAWTSILDSYAHKDAQGVTWILHQDGDVWEVPDTLSEVESDEFYGMI